MGKPVEGVEVKLSDGKTGEIMVKSPRMLIGYLNDAKQTREAFDQDGYFKTGDLSKMINNEFIFHGRANSDFVQHDVFQISAVDVESNLLDLPYITEACVVGVPDNDTRHHCAAIVRVQRPDDYKLQAINLALIRSDLEAKLAHFMLPTLLRILGDDESLPVTISGKVVRREALRQFFGVTEGISETRLPCNVERWVYSAKSQAG
jgi:malonyl-CoA/methylmalonyl-CoA synthetase